MTNLRVEREQSYLFKERNIRIKIGHQNGKIDHIHTTYSPLGKQAHSKGQNNQLPVKKLIKRPNLIQNNIIANPTSKGMKNF